MSNTRRKTRSSARWLIFTRNRTGETISVDKACQALVDRHVAAGTLERLLARVPDGGLLRLRHVLGVLQADFKDVPDASWKRVRSAQQAALWLDANVPDITPSELLDLVAGRVPDDDADDLLALWESHDRNASLYRLLQIAKATGSADVVRGVRAINAFRERTHTGRKTEFGWVSATASPPDVSGSNEATPSVAAPKPSTGEGKDVESAPKVDRDTAEDAPAAPVEDKPAPEPTPSGTESCGAGGAGSTHETDTAAGGGAESAPESEESECPEPQEAGGPQTDRGDATKREAVVRTVRGLLATFGTERARVQIDVDGVQVTVYVEAA